MSIKTELCAVAKVGAHTLSRLSAATRDLPTKELAVTVALLGAFAEGACAQSSVTVFGFIDQAARWVSNDGQGSRKTLSGDSLNANRLGFRGVEDLGGGVGAGFWLEAQTAPDTGTIPTTRFFHRRSTVSLTGPWGEVRLGRDVVPTYWNLNLNDPFFHLGVGSALGVMNFGSAYAPQTQNTTALNR
jgi:predicted porin